jgi:hypothetical protein
MGVENLKPCKPGETHNPKGRPKGAKGLSTLLRKYLKQKIDFNDPISKENVKKALGDVVILKLLSNAIKGDMRAIQEILDRTEGKASQLIEHKGNINEPITVRIIAANGNTRDYRPREESGSDNADRGQSGGDAVEQDVFDRTDVDSPASTGNGENSDDMPQDLSVA